MSATLSTDQIRRVVLESLRKIVPDANLETIAPDRNIRGQLDLDSMDFLNFVVAVAEALDIEIDEADYDRLATLDGCIDFLTSQNRSTSARRVLHLTG